MPGTLRFVLGDQCSRALSSLEDLDPAADVVLMAEVMAECTYVKHHPKKIVLVLSAMRHFARALEARGVRVDYVTLDDPANTHSLRGELLRAAERHRPGRIVATECGEWRLETDMRAWQEATGVETEIRDDTRFLCRKREFRAWAAGRKGLRMEFFYREMRKRYGILIDEGEPAGGRWNYDRGEPQAAAPRRLNRRPAGPAISRRMRSPQDGDGAGMAERFAEHFGAVDGFALPVTAARCFEAPLQRLHA